MQIKIGVFVILLLVLLIIAFLFIAKTYQNSALIEPILQQGLIIKPEPKITLIATGDIIPARSVNYQTVSRKNFNWPYEKTYQVLKDADITFANLESPLVKNCPLTQEGMVFCGDERNIEGLKFAGIDVVNLANNHAGNYGKDGVENTVKLLNQADILATGIIGPVFKEIKGIKFAFLGYNDIEKRSFLSSAEENKISQEINEAKKQADVAVVAFHWGVEYQSQPSLRQIQLAHLAIDFGADLIIGNHPHWVQSTEYYKDKFIMYAHGNFVFDQMWSQKTREGVVGKYTFAGKKLENVEFIPIVINFYGQPDFVKQP